MRTRRQFGGGRRRRTGAAGAAEARGPLAPPLGPLAGVLPGGRRPQRTPRRTPGGPPLWPEPHELGLQVLPIGRTAVLPTVATTMHQTATTGLLTFLTNLLILCSMSRLDRALIILYKAIVQ